ncbi:hypothetical protein HAX54_019156 [Datura stramonium]|uniref:Uncharacterized protein n=1 Tax=Datura stramonium TaxID=4076 RepID=A0ABS8UQT3_DATST|nr:hypothetical protein [Datura stramonium]
MAAYYLSFKEKRAINEEAHFDVDSFKADFPNIDKKFQIRYWEPFIKALGPYFLELRVDEVFDLSTKRDKDAPAFKRLKLTLRPSDPPLTDMSEDTSTSSFSNKPQSIKTAMKPVVDKFESLCARVDVLQDEMASMREEINMLKETMPLMDIYLNITEVGCDSPVAGRSSLNDLCVRYNPSEGAVAGEVQDGEPSR